MAAVYEFRRRTLLAAFDLVDAFAESRGMLGPHPGPIVPVRFSLAGQVVNGVRVSFNSPLEMVVRRNDQ